MDENEMELKGITPVSPERYAASQEANRLNAAVHRAMAEQNYEKARSLRVQERLGRRIARGEPMADVFPFLQNDEGSVNVPQDSR